MNLFIELDTRWVNIMLHIKKLTSSLHSHFFSDVGWSFSRKFQDGEPDVDGHSWTTKISPEYFLRSLKGLGPPDPSRSFCNGSQLLDSTVVSESNLEQLQTHQILPKMKPQLRTPSWNWWVVYWVVVLHSRSDKRRPSPMFRFCLLNRSGNE